MAVFDIIILMPSIADAASALLCGLFALSANRSWMNSAALGFILGPLGVAIMGLEASLPLEIVPVRNQSCTRGSQ